MMHVLLILHTATPNCCGPGCRLPDDGGSSNSSSSSHYNAEYFQWQEREGVKKARATRWAKLLNVTKDDIVVDFGAGTGAILASLKGRVAKTCAVEYSDHARRYMAQKHPEIERFKYPELMKDESVTMVFSTSVIEHVECPINELRELRKKLVPGGRIMLGIKNEGVELWTEWKAYNRDNHLYTWNTVNLGNTLRAAGFIIDNIKATRDRASTEAFINAKQFGAAGHTFQYLFARGHKPRAGEEWPQPRSTIVPIEEPPVPAKHGINGAKKDKAFGWWNRLLEGGASMRMLERFA